MDRWRFNAKRAKMAQSRCKVLPVLWGIAECWVIGTLGGAESCMCVRLMETQLFPGGHWEAPGSGASAPNSVSLFCRTHRCRYRVFLLTGPVSDSACFFGLRHCFSPLQLMEKMDFIAAVVEDPSFQFSLPEPDVCAPPFLQVWRFAAQCCVHGDPYHLWFQTPANHHPSQMVFAGRTLPPSRTPNMC